MKCALALLLLVTPALGLESSLTFDAEAAKNRPVSKVITLLKDMLKQLEKEAEEDEEIYDKMAFGSLFFFCNFMVRKTYFQTTGLAPMDLAPCTWICPSVSSCPVMWSPLGPFLIVAGHDTLISRSALFYMSDA